MTSWFLIKERACVWKARFEGSEEGEQKSICITVIKFYCCNIHGKEINYCVRHELET